MRIKTRAIDQIWVDDGEPVTWRHYVLIAFWMVTLVPEVVFVGVGVIFTWIGETLDGLYGRAKKWANPVRRGKGLR